MRMMPCAAPGALLCGLGFAALVSGVVHLVGVQKTVQKNGNMKSEPEYLACEESSICAFYF